MEPESLSAWIPIFRDIAIVCLAAFVVVFGTLSVKDPLLLSALLGFAGTLLGIPAAIRADKKRQQRNGGGDGDRDERWSGLP